MKFAKLLIVLMLATAAAPSFAARARTYDTYGSSASRFYAGLGVGYMKNDIPGNSNTSIPWNLVAGTSINQFLAAEIAYTNLGTTDLGSGINLKGAAYSLNLVGTIPVTQAVSMYAKFGFANTGVYSESGSSTGATISYAAPTIGLGVRFPLSAKTDMRIAYDNYKFQTTNTNPVTYNADVTSVAVLFKF